MALSNSPKIFTFFLGAAIALLVNGNSLFAQNSTWEQVHGILQQSCAGASCHDGSTPLTLLGTESDIYNNLININPTNPEAFTRGYKLVDPGYPHLSYLLKKVNNGLDSDNDLDTIALGDPMPSALLALSNEDIDLINAWIVNGAPQTGIVVDTALINDYHNGMGLPQKTPPPAPPASEGFQIHLGPIFLSPNNGIDDNEKEFFMKYKLPFISDTMEVTRIESFIDVESHHYIIYKFDDAQSANNVNKKGLREVTGFFDAFTDGTTMVAAWQNSTDINLPPNTAYFWEPNLILDLNLHVRNYNPDSVLKAEIYTNVYLQPKQTNTIEMISDLVLFNTIPLQFVPCSLSQFCIPGDSQDYTFVGNVTSNNLEGLSSSDSMYIWMLSSHTHKYGVGFNIYERNPGGPNSEKGTQVYDGFYNFGYTFNQGFYDYEDPAVRYFDPNDFVLKAGDGLVHEATFNNTSTTDVGFGLTTEDEMMLTFFQYTKIRPASANPSSITERQPNNLVSLYPNPTTNTVTISIKSTHSNASSKRLFYLHDLVGKEVARENFAAGKSELVFSKGVLKSGVYLYEVRDNGVSVGNGKLILY
ncbi:MAG TPA: T9SS type A sorting domain-containing protein [Flavobacteriales bacterium]|nr:T9SS type A sorting domain-containing protein [Flavobacteriales bacterium]